MTKYTYREDNGRRYGEIHTRRGVIRTPTFIPVTTFGNKYPLDRLVQPYLKRLAQCVMVSYHYALKMTQRPSIPMFIDSGGFASLFEGAAIEEHRDYACIRTPEGEELHPARILDFQEQHADLAATLDFVIAPGMDQVEARRRQKLTIKNAFYALQQRRSPSLLLYASLQCWDERSARVCAREYARAGFDGIAIGGLVPRIRDLDYVKRIVSAVREEAPAMPLHIFGLGKPEVVNLLWNLGVDSVDSSSYVRDAVDVTRPLSHVFTHPRLVVGRNLAGQCASLVVALENLWRLSTLQTWPLATGP